MRTPSPKLLESWGLSELRQLQQTVRKSFQIKPEGSLHDVVVIQTVATVTKEAAVRTAAPRGRSTLVKTEGVSLAETSTQAQGTVLQEK